MGIVQRVVVEPFEKLWDKILQFLPNLFAAVLLLVVGVVLAGIVKAIAVRLFRAVKMDKLVEHSGVAEVLKKGWIAEPMSVLLSRVIGWIVVFCFVIISLQSLDVPAVENLLERFFLYLPNVFVAVLVLVFGYFMSNFLGRTALIAAVNAGVTVSGLVGKFVEFTVFVLSVTMALELLGIGSGTVVVAFAIIFGGVVLALAIAFGLGGRELAKSYLEKKMKGEEKRDEISHL